MVKTEEREREGEVLTGREEEEEEEAATYAFGNPRRSLNCWLDVVVAYSSRRLEETWKEVKPGLPRVGINTSQWN